MLHELVRPSSYKRKKMQIGRGNSSGKGNYSTKGHKGQRARSGFSQQPGFEGGQTPLHMRLPKLRGFKKHFKLVNHVVAINLSTLQSDDRITDGSTVTTCSLKDLGYGKKNYSFKILGQGSLEKKLTIQGIPASKSAVSVIEKAGGSIE